VLAGKILPALKMAICWKPLLYNLAQSAGNLGGLSLLEIFRDYTPEYFYSGFILVLTKYGKTSLCKSVRSLYPGLFIAPYRTKYTVSTQATDLLIEYKHFNKLPFASYLTGLIEGDGTIIVPKMERSIKGVLNYASVQIVFHLKDLPLALMIQKVLGEGSIARKKGVNAYVLTINSYKGLILIVSILNGNMRSPKIECLYKLIDWLNNSKNTNFKKKPLNNSSLIFNA
jgi:LAGLIDADG DNA endonuclease family protein